MRKLIKDLIFAWRYKRAVRRAVEAQRLTGRKQFVILYGGKPVVVSKKKLSQLVATHSFKKGVKIQDIERRALFITSPSLNDKNKR